MDRDFPVPYQISFWSKESCACRTASNTAMVSFPEKGGEPLSKMYLQKKGVQIFNPQNLLDGWHIHSCFKHHKLSVDVGKN